MITTVLASNFRYLQGNLFVGEPPLAKLIPPFLSRSILNDLQMVSR